jgi:hypothetical protein
LWFKTDKVLIFSLHLSPIVLQMAWHTILWDMHSHPIAAGLGYYLVGWGRRICSLLDMCHGDLYP